MTANPFTFGSPIRERQQFFDREGIVRQVMDRLRTMQDSSVIGERCMGKTSLLYHLNDPEVLRRHGLDPSQYLMVYFSFEGAGALTPTRFWQQLLQPVATKVTQPELRAMVGRLIAQEEIDPIDVEDIFLEIARQDLRVVFLLDQFETVTQATGLNADFFSTLRSLATGHYLGLVFVTSSRQKLSELSHAGLVGSPFFNIFETFLLKPFDPVTSEAIFDALLDASGVSFEATERAYLIELTGGHPFFLQMAASLLYDTYIVQHLNGPTLLPVRLERVERQFINQSEPHFAHYWAQSTDLDKIFLAAIAARSQLANQRDVGFDWAARAYRDAGSVVQSLLDRGLISQRDTMLRIFSPAYSRWILAELTRPGARANYATWLEQNEPYYRGALQGLRARAQDVNTAANPRYWNLLTEWLTKSTMAGEILDLLNQAHVTDLRPIWWSFIPERSP